MRKLMELCAYCKRRGYHETNANKFILWNNDAGYLYAGRINANNERRIIMWKDPIVQEVRKAGEELAEQANYSLRDLFQRLRVKILGTVYLIHWNKYAVYGI